MCLSPSSLPVEIWQIIADIATNCVSSPRNSYYQGHRLPPHRHLDWPVAVVVSRISKTFRGLVIRRMYETVTLTKDSQVQCLANHLSSSAASKWNVLDRTLFLRVYQRDDEQFCSDNAWTSICHILRSCKNLKAISFSVTARSDHHHHLPVSINTTELLISLLPISLQYIHWNLHDLIVWQSPVWIDVKPLRYLKAAIHPIVKQSIMLEVLHCVSATESYDLTVLERLTHYKTNGKGGLAVLSDSGWVTPSLSHLEIFADDQDMIRSPHMIILSSITYLRIDHKLFSSLAGSLKEIFPNLLYLSCDIHFSVPFPSSESIWIKGASHDGILVLRVNLWARGSLPEDALHKLCGRLRVIHRAAVPSLEELHICGTQHFFQNTLDTELAIQAASTHLSKDGVSLTCESTVTDTIPSAHFAWGYDS